MATYDEFMTLILLYVLMYFSDYLTDPQVINDWGIVYICTVCLYAGVHMAFLYYDSWRSLFLRARWAYRRRRQLKVKYKKKACDIWGKVRAKLCKKKQEPEEEEEEDEEDEEEEEPDSFLE